MEKTTAELYREEVEFRRDFDLEGRLLSERQYREHTQRMERAIAAEERTADALESIAAILLRLESEGK